MCQCQGWGMEWMQAFHQAYRQCPNLRREEPEFSKETVERLLHNLVLKIVKYFYHMPIQPSDLLEVMVEAPVAGAHDSSRGGCQDTLRGLPAQRLQRVVADPGVGCLGTLDGYG
ncbi:PREDICTED: receptor-transporting protein 3-like [Cariama cristata]|uniref:receptor-transporting protein 3-like n=1 Tax=Cariama cristata TaxID=54380 RepID=UPI0005203A3F|nr:PREDICTED: receptor-transporting protein 3-like [Cariama cristata]